ncbi:MAG: family 10 glycosylhydrolase [Saprospiraceae bacterium]|nr:family 10 glycosylhydrolase [Saprospiraceae bacterium]
MSTPIFLRCCLALLFYATFVSPLSAQTIALTPASSPDAWPADIPWWKRNNLRVMQCNLPAYEATLNVDHLVEDLQRFSVNTLIINGGGIMAFYPTELEFQYTNPFMQPNMLPDIIKRCHDLNIRVVTRFDFSRFHRSIFEKHPDWAYISPSDERIINDDMYMASINAPYVQEKSVSIVKELITKYPVDGIFINMPGYNTRNAYEGTYHGIDQNEYDRKRFAEFSGGMTLPKEENERDPAFQKYQEFKKYTANDWMENIHQAIKTVNPDIAICTYMEKFVDIIRHESQTNSLPYWPYMSYDNVTNAMQSQPEHIVSNASIQQISFRSRYNAIEPEETAIRLYENLAAGSGLDISLMGDFRDYEDERNFPIWEEIYAFHKKYEPYFGKYRSPAEICIISPAYWPGGTAAQEYRGIQLMLKEAHLQYDIIQYEEIEHLGDKLKNYRLVILPQIPKVSDQGISILKEICENGTSLITTNQSLIENRNAPSGLFGVQIDSLISEGEGFYLEPDDKKIFKRFGEQTLLFWKFNLGLYDMSKCDARYLPILSPGRPGPPEKIGGHEPTGYFAVGMKNYGKGVAISIPLNLGRLYYIHGYEQHKHILLDIIESVFPDCRQLIDTDAHPRVELVLQNFTENIAENLGREKDDGMILHLINLTGFSGNTYFDPLPVYNTKIRVRSGFKPKGLYSLKRETEVPYKWQDGYIELTLPLLDQYDSIIIAK